MDTNLDLNTASREVLLAAIAQQQAVLQEQQAVIAQLRRRIEVLEGKAKASGHRARTATGSPGPTASPASA